MKITFLRMNSNVYIRSLQSQIILETAVLIIKTTERPGKDLVGNKKGQQHIGGFYGRLSVIPAVTP